MALKTKNLKSGPAWLCTYTLYGRRCSLYLPASYTRREAEEVDDLIKGLILSNDLGRPLCRRHLIILDSLSPDLKKRLRKANLMKNFERLRLSELWERYFNAISGDLKRNTLLNQKTVWRQLSDFFNTNPYIDEIQKKDIDAFRNCLAKSYSAATVAGAVKTTRRLFNWAIEEEYMESNPSAGVARGVFTNPDRLIFVGPEIYSALLVTACDQELRTVLALTRYGGLRCTSEVFAATWSDILWDKYKMVVHSPKTERKGKASRVIPLFPELRKELDRLWSEQPDGTKWLVNRYRNGDALRHTFLKLIHQSGITPWQRLWQNLRASRATELYALFPWFVASAWLGQSVEVAKNHYVSVTEDFFLQAAGTVGSAETFPGKVGSIEALSIGAGSVLGKVGSICSAGTAERDLVPDLVPSSPPFAPSMPPCTKSKKP